MSPSIVSVLVPAALLQINERLTIIDNKAGASQVSKLGNALLVCTAGVLGSRRAKSCGGEGGEKRGIPVYQ